ncbi:MAG: hypothetical protein F4209_00455 [Chloroflexi bacterium]|nr:hypothetical protein [Chloroflexota bacterium]
MALPVRTSLDDIDAVCGYLMTKPTGATIAEARAVLDKKHLDPRKLTGLKYWGMIDLDDGRLKIAERGRTAVRDSGAHRSVALREVIRQTKPYAAIVERVAHREESSLTATDVASHWYEHFREASSDSDTTLNHQAIAFFQIAQGADLGVAVVGRKGKPTRFEFDRNAVQGFIADEESGTGPLVEEDLAETEPSPSQEPAPDFDDGAAQDASAADNRRMFITHGKDKNILNQVKQLVTFGKFEPVVAAEQETGAVPVPEKVMSEMRTCASALIHVSADRHYWTQDGSPARLINENVLIEIGAAMALYGNKFVLLVEEDLELPT